MDESPNPAVNPDPGRWRPTVVATAATAVAWAIWYLRGSWSLYGALAVGVGAGVVALGIWTPRPLRRLAEHNGRLAWVLPRIALAAVAIILIAVPHNDSPLPACADHSGQENTGELLYARLNGNTLVCRYQDTSMGTEL